MHHQAAKLKAYAFSIHLVSNRIILLLLFKVEYVYRIRKWCNNIFPTDFGLLKASYMSDFAFSVCCLSKILFNLFWLWYVPLGLESGPIKSFCGNIFDHFSYHSNIVSQLNYQVTSISILTVLPIHPVCYILWLMNRLTLFRSWEIRWEYQINIWKI